MIRLVPLLLLAAPAGATPYDSLSGYLGKHELKTFARDVAHITSPGVTTTARTLPPWGLRLGMSFNFDTVPFVEDSIWAHASRTAVSLPVFRGALGLPRGFEAWVEGSGELQTTLLGGGLRWQVLRGPERSMTRPSALVYAGARTLAHRDFDGAQQTVGALVSVHVLLWEMALGAALDRTTVAAFGDRAEWSAARWGILARLDMLTFAQIHSGVEFMDGTWTTTLGLHLAFPLR